MSSKSQKLFPILTLLAFFLSLGSAKAIPITFNYDGVDGAGFTATGSLTIDDGLFNGTSFQLIENSLVSDFSFEADTSLGLFTFSTSDLVGGTVYNSTINPPEIVASSGGLAESGFSLLSLPAPGLGNARLIFNDGNTFISHNYSGSWTVGVSAVPEPTTNWALFGFGLLGVFLARRRRICAVN